VKLCGQPVVVVAWRGSKSMTDWTTTDPDMKFVRLERGLERPPL